MLKRLTPAKISITKLSTFPICNCNHDIGRVFEAKRKGQKKSLAANPLVNSFPYTETCDLCVVLQQIVACYMYQFPPCKWCNHLKNWLLFLTSPTVHEKLGRLSNKREGVSPLDELKNSWGKRSEIRLNKKIRNGIQRTRTLSFHVSTEIN